MKLSSNQTAFQRLNFFAGNKAIFERYAGGLTSGFSFPCKALKAESKARYLQIDYDRAIGYSIARRLMHFWTSSESGFDMGIRLARVMPQKKASSDHEKPHKYVCPICGQEVKSTADLKIKCAICDVDMEMVN